jgi:GNAT superfamily N-acetyltransferase
MVLSPSSSVGDLPVRRIRFWQHRLAVSQMLRAYPPGTDAAVDHIRAAGFLTRFAVQQLLLPLYFAREQGWSIRGTRGAMAAIIYVRRNERQGIRVLHIDDISVDARYRRHGLAQRLMSLAEELAHREQRPFLKLAVTVANTPAVTLYRRLGYQEQHHRFVTYDPAISALRPPESTDLTLRPVGRRQGWKANRQFYHMEMRASDPAVANMQVAYYPRGAGDVGVPRAGTLRYALELRGQQIGYGDAYRRGTRWNLRLSLTPELWGTESDRQAIQLLTNAVTKAGGPDVGSSIALHVPSAAHFDALCAGPNALASELGFSVQHYERMIMVKVVASTAKTGETLAH